MNGTVIQVDLRAVLATLIVVAAVTLLAGWSPSGVPQETRDPGCWQFSGVPQAPTGGNAVAGYPYSAFDACTGQLYVFEVATYGQAWTARGAPLEP